MMFFDSWYSLLRILIIGTTLYVMLVGVLRVSGNRSLSKWNAFDFVVTIAIGSTFASAFLSKDISLLDGALAVLLILGLQYAITWASVRSRSFALLVKASPKELVRNGRFIDKQMVDSRVAPSEVKAAIRSHGIGSLSNVGSVVLETDGSISVISMGSMGDESVLDDVEKRTEE